MHYWRNKEFNKQALNHNMIIQMHKLVLFSLAVRTSYTNRIFYPLMKSQANIFVYVHVEYTGS